MTDRDGIVLGPLEQHRDERGSVFEPLTAGALAGQRNAHVVLTDAGHVRGNHYHTRGTETMAVQGPALVRYRSDGETRDVTVEAGDVVLFRFPAHIPHAVRYDGDGQGLIVAFRDVPHDPSSADTVRDVLI